MIVFSHANSYSAATYRQLFDGWRAAGHEVAAVEHFGHDARFPVDRRWRGMTQQLTTLIDSLPQPRVWLVGHSMGGYLSLLAACKRPEIARSVVLLDSPVLTGWKAHSVQVMKVGRLIQRFSPGRVSARRRWQWPSTEAALAHFQAKAAFARWDPAVLRDYIAAGTEPDPEGADAQAVRLAFHRDVETRIYNTLVHKLGRVLQAHPPKCPVAYVGGTRSHEGRQVGLAATRALAHERLLWIEGSHLFPMEQPQATAQAVLDLLAGAQPIG